MSVLLGIDLGTSSVKAMLADSESGATLGVGNVAYDVDIPKPGYAEQSPEGWYEALISTLASLRENCPREFDAISAIGLSGQMHGLVLTDENDECVRPAINWLDQRSKRQLSEIYDMVSIDEMRLTFKNRVASGFAFPSLLWVREEEPDVYARARCVMLPKDYIRLRLTGERGSDASDASSSTIFDVERRDWAWNIIDRFGFDKKLFPQIREAKDVAGRVTRKACAETGLKEGIPVVYGAGDQPCYSMGIGAITQGALSTSIGTGGQMASFSHDARSDALLRTHTFCHAIEKGFTVYGATLCSGMSLNWLKNKIIHAESYKYMDDMAAKVPAGCGGLVYLPYLSGERTPHMNPNCTGMFLGLTLGMDDAYLSRAVMEGVVFSFRDCFELLKDMGLDSDVITAAGSGTKSPLWLQMQADILGRRVRTCAGDERACVGACMLAGIGTGAYSDAGDAVKALVRMGGREYEPNPQNCEVYSQAWEKYRKAYADNFA